MVSAASSARRSDLGQRAPAVGMGLMARLAARLRPTPRTADGSAMMVRSSLEAAGGVCGVRAFSDSRRRCDVRPWPIRCASTTADVEAENPVAGAQQKPPPLYPFADIEPKWQRIWEERKTFRTPQGKDLDTSKDKFYVLDMFPYPSGAGLHVGHPEGYTATDIMARYKRMRGFNVMHPMGWDAFGLPAEQYAISTGTHPRDTTVKNVARFRAQLKSLGFSFDWDREISTTDPAYYKWTQWIFLRLLERGLAYQAEVPVNWCPALGTVLANEEVIDGLSERGSHPVVRVPMKQWMLKITQYADRLLEDLDELDWSESIKEMQRNWIGRSEGATIDFALAGRGEAKGEGEGEEERIRVFTTRADTLFGATYVVLAPEHPLVSRIVTDDVASAVESYVAEAARKSDLERTELQKTKTGVFTGAYAVHPATGAPVPIWVADYVLGSYGSGAVMAVPSHDTRDYDFAVTHGLPKVRVVVPPSPSFQERGKGKGKEKEKGEGEGEGEEGAYVGEGTVVGSSNGADGLDINGLDTAAARTAVVEWLESRGLGGKQVNYKLRDWLFARQRYWGEPFPVVFEDGPSSEEGGEGEGEEGVPIPIPESELPLVLPEVKQYKPEGTMGQSPLALATDWVATTVPGTDRPARRDTNTMPQWAGSCWYYLRFLDPQNDRMLIDPEVSPSKHARTHTHTHTHCTPHDTLASKRT